MKELKETLNLPNTGFSMKANLAQKEPKILDHWKEIDLYSLLQEKNKDKQKFILHDGPPYANGPIHLGHVVNKVLKDIIIKNKVISGYNTPYIPGWDCHGLPIELNVEKKSGKVNIDITATDFRAQCREHANQQIAIQRNDFKRLGVLGDWSNPYKTMDYKFEANIVRSLGKIIEADHLSRGSKPVYWCDQCSSALAEAEVEYFDKESKAIDFLFPIHSDQFKNIFGDLKYQECFIASWTTTPWTIPGNKAICFNSKLDYELFELKFKGKIIDVLLCSELVETFFERCEIKEYKSLGVVKGDELSGLVSSHPFLKQDSPLVSGEHVTSEMGTGFVHTAPAHGLEDYDACRGMDIDFTSPVRADGTFGEDIEYVGGKNIKEGNEIVIDLLLEKGLLLAQNKYRHSFPNCWRHKTPLFFRATPQWFISMDKNNLLKKCEEKIEEVNWLPEWGKTRISSMMSDRPDWCVSRQRSWGVPITLFIHKETGDLHKDTLKIIEKVAQRIETEGTEAWFSSDSQDFIGNDADNYEKVTDTLDVWFDSGVTHFCVLNENKNLSYPADLYLEGSDQHRGWFQSSLLTGMAINKETPYRTALTHGFVVDSKGRKMSKSVGNVISPQSVWNKRGADILRAWVASTDFRNEMNFSEEIMDRTSDSYRRIRNTMRFLMSNLYDFDSDKDLIQSDKYTELDKWIVLKAKNLQEDIKQDYENYEIHLAFQKILNFCTNELGGFYLDIIKDRLYTSKKDGDARKSSQSALFQLLNALITWIAPILSYTAEEAYLEINKNNSSIFLSGWFEDWADLESSIDDETWKLLIETKTEVNKFLEEKRNNGEIGSSLEAEVTLHCDDQLFMRLSEISDELKYLFITSKATLTHLEENKINTEIEGLMLSITPSDLEKCDRCWHHVEGLSNFKEDKICSRCKENIEGQGEVRSYI
ncbi:isoleucine--tRNA ligase [SAR86 cluster bacterium]|nr:isoleucine--tRNA ligase [SAR86 cluster bacterium]